VMQVLLKMSDMDVKAKHLRGERVPAGKFLRSTDATLPRRSRHLPIIGPGKSSSNPERWQLQTAIIEVLFTTSSGLTLFSRQRYSLRNLQGARLWSPGVSIATAATFNLRLTS
jgi:hypothetical protein